MSRRNTYLLGGLAVVAGVAMLVIAIVVLSGGDESTSTTSESTTERPITSSETPAAPPSGEQPAQEPSGSAARGAGIGRELAQRRPVRAPGFSAELIYDGSIPQALKEAFGRASGGGRLDMSKLRGTPVVLHLWSTGCAACRADGRLVEATWKRWGPRGVLLVGASVKESPAAAKTVIRQYDLTYPEISDRSGQVAELYGASALPQTFFISAAGDIVGEVVGSPSVRQLEVGTAAAESGKPFGSEQGNSRVPLD
jgi:peroxiredoxin